MPRTSERGIAFIKRQEGFVKNAQWDVSQWSIGYGSHCKAGEYPNGITEEDADKLLRLELETEMEPVVAKVERTRGKQFCQCEWDALASFTYNLGARWANSKYSVYKFVTGEYPMDENGFIATMEVWSHADLDGDGESEQVPGLLRRRREEARMYLYGDYSDGQPYNKDEEQEENEMRYEKLKDIKDKAYKGTIDKLLGLGFLRGKGGSGEETVLDLGEDAVRLLVVLDRAGVFDEKPAAAADVDLNALGKVIVADVVQRIANG